MVIFPEGTRIAVGKRGKYQLGGAWLAVQTGAPVLPVAHNAGMLWPRNSFLKYPGQGDGADRRADRQRRSHPETITRRSRTGSKRSDEPGRGSA